jgi:hypothetical protein
VFAVTNTLTFGPKKRDAVLEFAEFPGDRLLEGRRLEKLHEWHGNAWVRDMFVRVTKSRDRDGASLGVTKGAELLFPIAMAHQQPAQRTALQLRRTR